MTHLPLDEALRRLDAVDWERIAEQITTDTGLKLYPPGARAAFRRGLVSLYTGPGTGEPAALPPESASTGLTGTNEGPIPPWGRTAPRGLPASTTQIGSRTTKSPPTNTNGPAWSIPPPQRSAGTSAQVVTHSDQQMPRMPPTPLQMPPPNSPHGW